jgi:hypothetical protein
MKRTLALITAAAMATPALAWGPREQGALAGIVGTLIFQHVTKDAQAGSVPNPQPVYVPGPVVVQQPPVIVQQPPVVYVPQPQPQVILQNTGIVCPQGLAPFFNQRTDRYGRIFYVFDGCR